MKIGDLDNGVDHLAKAVAVCSQPQSLMALFQQTLPPELFQEIIMRLPRIAQVYF
jgi:import receptor subunit TOM20